MRHKSIRRMWLPAMAMLVVASQAAWSAEKVPSERLLPPNTYAYLSIPNVPELKSRFNQTQYGKLREDDAFEDFFEDVAKKIEEFSGQVEEKVGLKLDDLLAVPAGELSIAVVQPQGKSIGGVAILDFGKNEESVNKVLDSAAKAAEEDGAKKSEKEIDGTKVIVFDFPKEEADDDGNADDEKKEDGDAKAAAPGRQMVYFIRDSHLVVGTDVAVIESVLERWDGKNSQTLAANTAFAYIQENSRSGSAQPALTWFVNPLDLLRAVIAMSSEANPQAAMVLGFLPALGVNNFKAVGGSMDLATAEYDSVSKTIMFIEQPTTGILNVFQFPATEQAPPSWVTDDTSSYFAFNWDVPGAYGAVEALFDTFQGPGAFAGLIDGMAGQGPKLHVKKDIIDQLTGQMHVASDSPDADDPQKQRFLFAVDVKDEAKIKEVLDKVAKSEGFPGETREFHGSTIYEVDAPTPGGAPNKMGICVANGHLLISNDVTRVDQLLLADKDRKPLSSSPDYQKIAKNFPSKTSMLGFQRQDVQMRALYEMIRSGEQGQQIEGIDFKKLPPFEALQKYLSATGSYAVPDKNGALFVNFSLKPESK
ncbi:MAG: DUF3352 domain-containing protein [Planctomycetaceae bacterium]